MNVTLHLGSWVVPLFITALGIIATFIMAYLERRESGWFAGMFTALVAFICIIGVAIAWLVWGLTMWLR